MDLSPVRIKLVTLFVLAFLCINVGGTVCLAYCGGGVTTAKASSDHCLHHKAQRHHHSIKSKSNVSVSASAESGPVICSSLAINLFSAPLEKKQSPADAVLVSQQPVVRSITVPTSYVNGTLPPLLFTPPKIDTRDLRVKNCVIRI